MVKPDVYTIIVAAGSGSRFGSDVPKQFLPLCGKPVVMHAIDTFREAFPRGKVLLVLSADAMEYWQELCRCHNFESPETVCGGATRTESVHNALRQIKAIGCRETDLILIHDGARPLVTAELATRVASAPDPVDFQAVVPGYTPSDSMVSVHSGACTPEDRSRYMLVQTPQAFIAEHLMRAYDHLGNSSFTDDASAVCHLTGAKLKVIEGERDNIKITHPGDIEIAEIFIRRRR